jgi:hypothetical protein
MVSCGIRLDGIVSKIRDSKYRSGRSTNWLKTESYMEADFLIASVRRVAGEAPQATMTAETGEAAQESDYRRDNQRVGRLTDFFPHTSILVPHAPSNRQGRQISYCRKVANDWENPKTGHD